MGENLGLPDSKPTSHKVSTHITILLYKPDDPNQDPSRSKLGRHRVLSLFCLKKGRGCVVNQERCLSAKRLGQPLRVEGKFHGVLLLLRNFQALCFSNTLRHMEHKSAETHATEHPPLTVLRLKLGVVLRAPEGSS